MKKVHMFYFFWLVPSAVWYGPKRWWYPIHSQRKEYIKDCEMVQSGGIDGLAKQSRVALVCEILKNYYCSQSLWITLPSWNCTLNADWKCYLDFLIYDAHWSGHEHIHLFKLNQLLFCHPVKILTHLRLTFLLQYTEAFDTIFFDTDTVLILSW